MMPLGENYFHFGLSTHSIIDLAALAQNARFRLLTARTLRKWYRTAVQLCLFLLNSVFHACVYLFYLIQFFMHARWKIRMCILNQSAVHGSRAECTWIRFSAVESPYVTGFRRPQSFQVAIDHIFPCLRAKVGFCNFCAQTGKNVVNGYLKALGRLIPMVQSVFWAEQRIQGHSAW